MRVVFLLFLLLLFSVTPALAEPSFSEKYERAYNIFHPLNQYRADNPLNPINQYDPGNPANPMNQYNPSNPYNPLNQFNPRSPLNPLNEYNPTTPFQPLNPSRWLETDGTGETDVGSRSEVRGFRNFELESCPSPA